MTSLSPLQALGETDTDLVARQTWVALRGLAPQAPVSVELLKALFQIEAGAGLDEVLKRLYSLNVTTWVASPWPEEPNPWIMLTPLALLDELNVHCPNAAQIQREVYSRLLVLLRQALQDDDAEQIMTLLPHVQWVTADAQQSRQPSLMAIVFAHYTAQAMAWAKRLPEAAHIAAWAVAAMDQGIERGIPPQPMVYQGWARILQHMGDSVQAITWTTRAVDLAVQQHASDAVVTSYVNELIAVYRAANRPIPATVSQRYRLNK